MRGNPAAACGKIKMVSPRGFAIFMRGMALQPAQALQCLAFCFNVTGRLVLKHVSPSHESASLGGVERFDPDKRANVDRKLPNKLLQQPFCKEVSKCEMPQGGGEAIGGIVSPVGAFFRPSLHSQHAIMIGTRIIHLLRRHAVENQTACDSASSGAWCMPAGAD